MSTPAEAAPEIAPVAAPGGERASVTYPTVTDTDLAARAEPVVPASASDLTRLGRFQIVRELGRGGMGVVLEAYDPTLDRRVALKLLSAELDERRTTRLLREAQALGRLSHPNVVGVYEVGTVDGQDFIAMELVEGQSLREWQQTPRPWAEVLEVYIQAGRGLAAAHAQGLVHRDFKPANCLISASGRVRVLDFGLAGDADELRRRSSELEVILSSGEADARMSASTSSPFEERLTRPGAVLGTPAYMSPEQRKGQGLDARSDQFSFGVSICEALFGDAALSRHPWTLAGKIQVLEGREGHRVPRALRRVLVRSLAVAPEERWPSMDAMLRALERCRRSRERWRWGAALVGTNLVLAAVLWGGGEATESPCADPQARLAGVWDPQRARAVAAALEGTGLGYARSTGDVVRERLTEYAEAWAQQHTSACEAAHGRGELSLAGFDRRMQCLEDRRQALDHAVRQLEEADAEVVEQAVRVVTGLPSLLHCADDRALQIDPQPPAELAGAVSSIRSELERARTRLRAGKYDAGLDAVEQARARAEPLGFAPLLAEVHLRRGELQLAMGRYEDAAADLRQALAVAHRHAHAEVAAEASTSLTFALGVPLSRYEEAELLGESALALAQRVDEGGPREAEALVGIAQVLAKHGQDAQAEAHFDRALALLRALPEVDPLDLVGALDGLRGVLRRQGRHAEAERLARDAVALVRRELGPEHPAVVPRLANLAAVLMAQGHHAQAEQELRVAQALGRESLPPGHPALAHVHGNLGAVLLSRGQPEAAAEQLEQALAIWERAHSPEHDLVADALANLGVAARGRGRPEDAEGYYRRALARYAEVYEAHHPKVAMVELNLSKVLLVLDRAQEAEEHLRRAQAAFERYGGPEHPDVGKTLAAWGQLDYREGRLAQARTRQRRALEIFEHAYPSSPPHPRVARALWALGRTEVALGEVELGRARLERALQIQREVEVRAIDRAQTEWTLARLEWRRAEGRARARELARQAEARLEGEPGSAAERLRDEIRAGLGRAR